MSTHQNYNLVFLNELWSNGKSYKTCELINNTASYVILSTYLIYVQYPDAILEYILPSPWCVSPRTNKKAGDLRQVNGECKQNICCVGTRTTAVKPDISK